MDGLVKVNSRSWSSSFITNWRFH